MFVIDRVPTLFSMTENFEAFASCTEKRTTATFQTIWNSDCNHRLQLKDFYIHHIYTVYASSLIKTSRLNFVTNPHAKDKLNQKIVKAKKTLPPESISARSDRTI